MTRWAVIFENAMGETGLKDRYKDAHHAYLQSHRGVIQMAGAIRDGDVQEFSGSIWIIECEYNNVRELVENCPFYRCGYHKSYRLVWWGSAPGFEEARIV